MEYLRGRIGLSHTIQAMAIERMDHVGIVVNDMAAATEFFEGLGLVNRGGGAVGGEWVDRVIGVEGVSAEVAMLEAPDGGARVELATFNSPADGGEGRAEASNVPGIRHVTFRVDDLDAAVKGVRAGGYDLVGTIEQYENIFRLCYVRGPEGIIVELAQDITPAADPA